MYAHQRHRYGQEEERLLLWLWQVWKIREVRLWQEIWLRLWVWIWEGKISVWVRIFHEKINQMVPH